MEVNPEIKKALANIEVALSMVQTTRQAHEQLKRDMELIIQELSK